MTIQIIDKQRKILLIEKRKFQFMKPYFLLDLSNMKIKKGVVRGSTLTFGIGSKIITYNQIRKLFKS